MKRTLLIILLFITTFSLAQQAYYDGIDFTLNGTLLKDELAVKIISTHTNLLSYTDRHNYLYNADEDPNNNSSVILIYSGESRYELEYESSSNPYTPQTFNTEHVYPRSLVNNTAEGDLHHLRVCDISINTSRGNLPFASGSGSYGSVSGGWYPGDEWKGDVARMIMYMNLRYDESFTDVGDLSIFLQWNAEDPVSTLEDQRNTIIFNAQGNRNPFIDNPYLATKIWGGTAAEDRWGTLGIDEITTTNFSMFPNPSSTHSVTIQSGNYSISDVALYNVFGQKILQKKYTENNNQVTLDNLQSGFYVVRVHSESGIASRKLVVK